eukprot:3349854-Amphidinium_carterae.1
MEVTVHYVTLVQDSSAKIQTVVRMDQSQSVMSRCVQIGSQSVMRSEVVHGLGCSWDSLLAESQVQKSDMDKSVQVIPQGAQV